AEKAKQNRTVFAQRRLKPEEVLPEWKRTVAAVGGHDEVRRFTDRSLARLGSGLEVLRRGFKAPLAPLPEEVRERLEAEGLTGKLRIDFAARPAPGCRPVQRSHPLVSVLAETLLERTLARPADTTHTAGDTPTDPGVLGRVGCWVSSAVTERTTVALLRLRHQLVTQRPGRGATTLLVEEATALAWSGAAGASLVEGADALALLVPQPAGDPPQHVRDRMAAQALELVALRTADLDAFAERRAEALLADHRRVREAAAARGSYAVKALLPPDVVAVYVLLPPMS
ncbi:MAG TPA: helicase SNF2, partial [Coriobacteriia bacterium]|nr:helicase SNF2 [Coriobacteriia bacterium]